MNSPRKCSWCNLPFMVTAGHARFCSVRCRQAAFRLRTRAGAPSPEAPSDAPAAPAPATRAPGRFAYADPPYPGRASRYYCDQPEYAGEVDHASLVASLERGDYLGWALSTASDSLRHVLPLCPTHARVCAWVKPIGASVRTNGLHSTWEPLIVVRGRQVPPGKRDWLLAQPARGGGSLPGRKPLAFCAWLFACLGMEPGDELVDLFPGSGVVSTSWREISQGRALTEEA